MDPETETDAKPKPVSALRGAELEKAGVQFYDGMWLYRTTGESVGHGGMGNAFVLARRPHSASAATADSQAVGKVFHSEYLYQLRTDEVTRRDHSSVVACLEALARVDHPNILPMHLSTPIADNHLTVTPRQAGTLLQAIAMGGLSQRRRVELLLEAMRGLAAMHGAGYIHRDFTLRNILCDVALERAFLFDFDLALPVADVLGETYKSRYQGRIFGSPGYSVAPEILDTQLMDRPIGQALDIYAVGGAIFSLFTDELPYGPAEDMWSLLLRITDGVVFGGKSRIVYPAAVPMVLRPIIEACMERDPDQRVTSVEEIIYMLEQALPELTTGDRDAEIIRRTFRYGDPRARVSAIYEARRDPTVSIAEVSGIDAALARQGYQLQRSMGRVMSHPIYMAAPNTELVAQGKFPDSNLYPKIVTALSLEASADAKADVEMWMGTYLPILRAARRGLLTTLHRVVFDEPSLSLLLFTEYVDDPRFGPALEEHELTLEEAFGLAYLVSGQVKRLHSRGMAHNNVSGNSLLLKGLRESRRVHPAMVGIVQPSLDPDDMFNDVRRLANLTMSWLRPARIEEAEAVHRARLGDVNRRIVEMAAGEAESISIDDFLDVVADGLSAIDFNFGVLRENGGDLDAYALLLVSHALYGRLWKS